jgi:glycosyltransferase involved in cell wall biosynthesis
VRALDLLLTPTETAAATMRDRGIDAPIVALPHFLPSDWAGGGGAVPPAPPRSERPYIAAAGRLVREKGFEELIGAMARLPDVDLRLAGAGPLAPRLRELAEPLANVELVGRLEAPELARLLEGAVAVVVPSLFHETFGFVTLEAASTGTPVVVRRRGALPEVAGRIGGSIVFDTLDELVAAIRRLASDPALRRRLGEQAREGARREGDEARHVDRYLELVDAAQPKVAAPRARAYRGIPQTSP